MSDVRPRSVRLRGRALWFQIHKWIGLLLFLVLIPVSASGSLLVWHDWLDSVVNPHRYSVSASSASLPPGDYVRAAQAVLGTDERIASVEFPDESGRPVLVSAARSGPGARQAGPPARTQLWLDPANAAIVDKADSRDGLVRFLHVFHGSLMVPGWGRTVVGWLGVAMLVSALTGIWLWLPVVGRLLRGFRWNRGPLTSSNLHHQVGIWVAIPLAVLSFTGAYISFPAFFRGVEQTIAPATPGAGAGMRDMAAGRRAPPKADTRLSPDQAIAAARSQGAGDVLGVRWPTDKADEWTIALHRDGKRVEFKVEDSSAAVTPAQPPQSGLARFMRQLHDGNGYNPVWQTIIFVAGLAPLLLGITGVIMWLRTRNWRKKASMRSAPA